MHRSVRLIARVWALWFAAVLAQPAPLMTCLMQASVAGTHAPAMANMPGMPGMPGDAGTHHRAPVDPSCSHLGACCCAPVLTAPSDSVPALAAAPTRLVHSSIPSSVALTPPPGWAHARPFAIGPPAALV